MRRMGEAVAGDTTQTVRSLGLAGRAKLEARSEPIINASTVSEALPGQWLAITGPRLLALLAPTATRRILRGVWQHAMDGKGVQETLDVLTADGLRDLMDFVVAEWNDVGADGVEVRVLVRGTAGARLITEVDDLVIETGQVSTWVEKVVPGVIGIQLFSDPSTMISFIEDVVGGDEFVDEHMLPLGTGAVRAGALILGQVNSNGETIVLGDDESDGVDGDDAAAEPEHIAEVTEIRSEEPVAEPVEEKTVMKAVPAAAPAAVATIRFSNGETIELDRDVYVGREPKPRRVDPNKPVHLVTVESDDNDISRTHFKLGVSNGRIMIRDLKSSNGTTITLPGEESRLLAPGEAGQLVVGTTIEFGDSASAVVAGVEAE